MKRAHPPLDRRQLAGTGVLLTTHDVAALLRVHPKHVYRLLRRGLPGHRVGGEWRFDADEVLSWSGAPRAHASASETAAGAVSAIAPLLAANGDIAVERLLARLNGDSASLGLVQADRGSGLELLRRHEVLAAGYHGREIPHSLEHERLAFIQLVERKVGLVLRAGVKLASLRQLRRRRLASRPESAGLRAHFDGALRKQGMDPRAIHAEAMLLASHRDVVCTVARGEADVGLASAAWAHKVGLEFLPLAEESYGLLVRAATLGDPRVVRLCEVMQSAALRRELAGIAGYRADHAGTIRYESGSEIHSA